MNGLHTDSSDPGPQGQPGGAPTVISTQGPHPHPTPHNLPAQLTHPRCRWDPGAHEAATGSSEGTGDCVASPLHSFPSRGRVCSPDTRQVLSGRAVTRT